MKWQEVLRNSVKGETIRAGSLRKIPQLKNCPHWDRAVFLGCITCCVGIATYDGGLVRYDNRIYYVNRSQMEALRPWVRWDLRKQVTVIND